MQVAQIFKTKMQTQTLFLSVLSMLLEAWLEVEFLRWLMGLLIVPVARCNR